MGMNASASSSSSGSENSTFIDPTQKGFLENLWASASGFADGQGAKDAVGGAIGGMMPGLMQAFGTLGNMTDPSAQIEAQTSALQSGLGSLFREEINPAITSKAIAGGGPGGGRQGVAQGVATGKLADAYTSGVGDITARANQQAVAAALGMPGFAAGTAGLAGMPFSAGMDPFAQLAGIIGGPTVLGQGSSWGESESASFGFGWS